MSIKTPSGRTKTIKPGDTITAISDLYGKIRGKVLSVSPRSARIAVPSSYRSPRTGNSAMGNRAQILPREIRKAMKG